MRRGNPALWPRPSPAGRLGRHRAAGELFDVGGGQAVRQSSHLDRHWRNIRTLASHNPRTYKARAVGAYEIDGTPLPNGAFF